MTTQTMRATVTNTSPGPRYFQASGANVTLQPRESKTVTLTEAEAKNMMGRVRSKEFAVAEAQPSGSGGKAEQPTAGAESAFPEKPLADGADTNVASNPPAPPPEEGFFTPNQDAQDGPLAGAGEPEPERQEDDPKPDTVSHAGGGWYYGLHNGERITEPMKKDAAEAYAEEHGVNIVS